MVSAPLGFIVLTLTHGRWTDDWDGVVHTNQIDVAIEYAAAAIALGEENVKIAALYEHRFEASLTEAVTDNLP